MKIKKISNCIQGVLFIGIYIQRYVQSACPQRPPLVCKNKYYGGRLLCCTLPPFLCWGIMVSEGETGY